MDVQTSRVLVSRPPFRPIGDPHGQSKLKTHPVPTSITHAGSLPAMVAARPFALLPVKALQLRSSLAFNTNFPSFQLQINPDFYIFSTTPPTMCHFALRHTHIRVFTYEQLPGLQQSIGHAT